MYVSKAAVLRKAAGRGLGALLLRWAVDRAWNQELGSVRLDVWKTNEALQQYYWRQDWRYLRTVEAEWRNSGALFWRPTERDEEAHKAFKLLETPAGTTERVTAGSRVIVPTDDGPISAACIRVTADMTYGEVTAGWESARPHHRCTRWSATGRRGLHARRGPTPLQPCRSAAADTNAIKQWNREPER